MQLSPLGAVLVVLSAPALAAAADVTVSLQGVDVPVGPTGTTVLDVARTRVGAERFAVIRARAPEQSSSCGAVPERVAVWGLLDGRWTEMAHRVVDRCLPGVAAVARGRRVEAAVRARIVDVLEAGVHHAEFHVRVVDPRLPLEQSTPVRYLRVGDRFALGRVNDPVAPTPGLAPERTVAALPDVRLDAQLTEWSAATPMVTNEHGSIWLAQQGDRLLVAADMLPPNAAAPTVTVFLSDPAAGTGRMLSRDGNHGRSVVLSCGEAPDPAVRCVHVGNRWHLEGAIDLATQLYHRRVVDAIGVLAVADAGGHRMMHTRPGMRLEAVRLAAPIDLLRGATSDVIAHCANGFVGRSSPAGSGLDEALHGALVTCGPLCRGGRCERTMGTGDAAGRLEFNVGGTCFRGTGPGGADVDGCRDGASARLVGALPAQGFAAVLGVERSWSADGTLWRQGELWTLVTASSEWRRLPMGEAQRGPSPFTGLSMAEGHPEMCREAGNCEALRGLRLHHAEENTGSVTGGVMDTLRRAGLRPQRDAR